MWNDVLVKKIGKLEQEMHHYTVFDINTAIQKQIKYALLSGELLHEKKKKSSILKITIKFPFDFIRYYILQRNFLNGYEGFQGYWQKKSVNKQ